MHVTIFLFDGITALDAIGVADPLSRLPEREIVFASASGAPVLSGDGFLRLGAGAALEAIEQTDLLIVPGGSSDGVRACIGSPSVRAELVRLDATSQITATVCTGALILGSTGALAGRRASTHWRATEMLPRFGAIASNERVIVEGKYWSAAGVTAGIDLGLRLCGALASDEIGAAVELSMHYAPEPPYGTGDPAVAPEALRRMVEERLSG